MKSIFEADTKNELLKRIDNLNTESNAQWGKMDVGQMLWHCKYPLKTAILNEHKGNGKLFAKTLQKKKMRLLN